ncbi:MAG: hypothetical protein OEY93_01445, partial [Anaerolineae bacterium]|nr:hypothetical protein [Anaerolineae bacterium]
NPSPKFVFLHLVIPHPPFVYDREGNPIQPKRVMGLLDGSDFLGDVEDYRIGYVDQMIYLNEILKKTVDNILIQSATPPIIIIQGDHGPGSMLNWDSVDSTCHWERISILNAYYFPDQDYSDLANNISPVNTFRIVFNHFFGTEFEILENKAFYTTDRQLFGQVDVTSELASSAGCSIP